MMAVVDISTVALATVTSFPSQVVSASTEIKQDFQTLIWKNEILKYYSKDKMIVINAFSDDYLMWWNNKEFIEEVDRDWAAIDEKKMIDMLLPKGDNLWGPLMFLWFSAINASDYSAPNNFQANDCPDLFTKILTYIVLNSAVTTMYAIALLILIIILVSRLFYLWIFIAISPVIILLNFWKVFDAWKAKDLFWLKNVLRLIFQPVIFWMFISIMLLFVVVAKDFFNTKSYNYSLWSISIIDRTSDSEMKIGDMVKIQIKELWKPVWDLFVALMTVIFMRFLIKLAIWQSTKWTKIWNFVTWIAEKAEEVALNTGFVPTPKWNIWFKQLKSLPYEYLSKKTYPSLENNTRKANKLLNRALWLNTMIESMDTKQQQELLNVATYSKNRSDFSKKIRDIKAENGWIKFSEFMDYFWIWASNNQENTDMNNVIKWWTEIIAKQFANYNVKDTLENKRSKFKEAFSWPNQKNKEAFNDFYWKVLWGKNTNVQEYQDLFRNNNWNIPV